MDVVEQLRDNTEERDDASELTVNVTGRCKRGRWLYTCEQDIDKSLLDDRIRRQTPQFIVLCNGNPPFGSSNSAYPRGMLESSL
jgi:hypothetical protein